VQKVFLESAYAVLLVAHLFATFVLVGSMTHNLICVWRYVGGRFGRVKQERLFVRVSLWSYVAVYVIGALIYPAFRVYMRGGLFDTAMPWATGLFEVKEHWAAVGLGIFFVYYFLRKNFDPQQEREKLIFLYAPLCAILNVIVWYTIVVGCWLTLLKGSVS